MATVILKVCDNSFQAQVLKGALAAHGIDSIIQGEHFSAIYGGVFGGNAFGVNLLVDEDDLELAKQIAADNVE